MITWENDTLLKWLTNLLKHSGILTTTLHQSITLILEETMNSLTERGKWDEKLIENDWIYETLSSDKISSRSDIIFKAKWIGMKMKWDGEKKKLNLKKNPYKSPNWEVYLL